ncbi:MAG: DoxX family protein [Gemmatimonadales bacterium]
MAPDTDRPDRENRLRLASLTLLRAVTGVLFFQHGAPKLFGSLPGTGESEPPVELFTLIGLSGVLEVFGGILIMAGLFTRPVAFILAGEMAFAYFTAHAPRGFWPGANGGELAALYCFVFLLFAADGAGRLSLDGWFRRRRASP